MKIAAIYWLAAPIGLLAANTVAHAAGPHSNLEEVVITASPHGKSSGDIAGSLNVLSGDTLRREAAATLGETLKNQVGIESTSFGPGVGLPVIRGLSGSRVAVLQNSSPVADASKTSPDHAIALEPLLADRIEILRGPASLRYGPGAIGGVVNVIDNRIHTRAHSDMEGALEARHNANSDGATYVGRLDGALAGIDLHVSGVTRDSDNIEIPGRAVTGDNEESSDGFVANSDTEADAWSIGLSKVAENLVLGVAMSRVDNNYGIPPGGHGHHEEEHDGDHGVGELEHGDDDHEHDQEEEDHAEDLFTRIDMTQTEYSGKLLWRNLPGPLETLDIDATHSEYRHRELEIGGGISAVGTRYGSRANHLRAELTHDIGGWLGAVGLQASETEFTARGAEAFVPANTVTLTGIYVTEETTMGPGTLSLGLRFDRQSADPEQAGAEDHNLVNASASYLLNLGESQQLSLIYAHAQRAPSAEELFADGEHAATSTYQIGDRGLDRESSDSLEITWSWDGPVLVNASVYHRQFDDFIFDAWDGSRFSHDLEEEGVPGAAACSTVLADFDNSEEEFDEALPCLAYRQEDATFTGAELEATLLVGEHASVRMWGDTVRARLDDSGNVPRVPPARLGINLDYSRGPLTTGLAVTHGFEQDDPGVNESATADYTRVDAHISWTADQWQVFLNGSNLSDEEIRNATSFLRQLAPEPGRAITLGARYSF